MTGNRFAAFLTSKAKIESLYENNNKKKKAVRTKMLSDIIVLYLCFYEDQNGGEIQNALRKYLDVQTATVRIGDLFKQGRISRKRCLNRNTQHQYVYFTTDDQKREFFRLFI